MDQSIPKLVMEMGGWGFAGATLFYVVKRLDKIIDMLAGITQLYTILITSMPEVKRRAKEDAERINKAAQKDE